MKTTEIKTEAEQQELQNAALLCAYVFGAPGGWYGVAKGSVGGVRSDYALIHSDVSRFASREIVEFLLTGDETELADLDAIREAVKEDQGMDALPGVRMLTFADVAAAVKLVRAGAEEAEPPCLPSWIRDVCGTTSDLTLCDWWEVTRILAGAARVIRLHGRNGLTF